MSPTDFKNAPDKDAEWMQVLLYGHLTCSNRSRQAVVINQTAS
jgi:hypothetical protein